LIVRGLGSGAVRTLVKRDPETSVVRTAVWSPDGRRVAFMVSLPATESRRISADINVVTLATGEVRTVTNQLLGGGMPGSPGRIPAFPITYLLRAWTIKDEILFTGSGRPDYSELFIVPAAGGESKALLKIPFPFIDMGGNQGRERIGNVTPDGAALVAVVSERLSLIDLSFGTPRVISERAGIASPQISPDGKLLAFLQRADSTWSVQVAPLGRLPIDHSVRVASLVHRAASVPEGQLRWTASETLTFAYTDNETDLYRLNVDPKTARSSGAPVRLNRDLDARTPEISPDGRQILFLTSSTRANPDNHIYIVGADGSNERRLIERANSGSVGIPPTTFGWLSNDEIVFSKPDTPELWSRNLRTGAQAAVANSASVGQQDTSGFQVLHEPARIVFARQEANPSVRTLMVHGLSDGHDQELVTMPARAQLSWSVTADLRKLAYWSLVPPLGRPEGQELHVVATDGSANKMLRAASGSGGSPVGGASWSPDGRHLLAGGRMWDSETGESWPLLDERTIASAGDWKWSPTGSYVVFKTQTTETRRLGWQRITIDAVSKLGGAKRGSVESVR
jgi:Tol biopolymer transport system component